MNPVLLFLLLFHSVSALALTIDPFEIVIEDRTVERELNLRDLQVYLIKQDYTGYMCSFLIPRDMGITEPVRVSRARFHRGTFFYQFPAIDLDFKNACLAVSVRLGKGRTQYFFDVSLNLFRDGKEIADHIRQLFVYDYFNKKYHGSVAFELPHDSRESFDQVFQAFGRYALRSYGLQEYYDIDESNIQVEWRLEPEYSVTHEKRATNEQFFEFQENGNLREWALPFDLQTRWLAETQRHHPYLFSIHNIDPALRLFYFRSRLVISVMRDYREVLRLHGVVPYSRIYSRESGREYFGWTSEAWGRLIKDSEYVHGLPVLVSDESIVATVETDFEKLLDRTWAHTASYWYCFCSCRSSDGRAMQNPDEMPSYALKTYLMIPPPEHHWNRHLGESWCQHNAHGKPCEGLRSESGVRETGLYACSTKFDSERFPFGIEKKPALPEKFRRFTVGR